MLLRFMGNPLNSVLDALLAVNRTIPTLVEIKPRFIPDETQGQKLLIQNGKTPQNAEWA